MATRTFCDHCGNTVRNPKRFFYGPCPVYDPSHQHKIMMQQGQAGGPQMQQAMMQQNQGGHTTMTPGVPMYPTKVIDLCETCTPIWLKRVAALTENSDPDEGN